MGSEPITAPHRVTSTVEVSLLSGTSVGSYTDGSFVAPSMTHSATQAVYNTMIG